MREEFVKAAQVGELSPGQKKLVRIGDEFILLVNLGGSYYAVDDECPHAYALLHAGQLYGDEVMCPLHGSAFNVRSGEVLSPPAAQGLKVYPVRVEGGDVLVGPAQA